jgi:hypothetical protein
MTSSVTRWRNLLNQKLSESVDFAKSSCDFFCKRRGRGLLNFSAAFDRELRCETNWFWAWKTHPSALKELILASLDILLLSTPCSQDGSLQSTTVWEGQSPWSLWLVVDGVQVDGSFLLRLTARQESDSYGNKIKYVSSVVGN